MFALIIPFFKMKPVAPSSHNHNNNNNKRWFLVSTLIVVCILIIFMSMPTNTNSNNSEVKPNNNIDKKQQNSNINSDETLSPPPPTKSSAPEPSEDDTNENNNNLQQQKNNFKHVGHLKDDQGNEIRENFNRVKNDLSFESPLTIITHSYRVVASDENSESTTETPKNQKRKRSDVSDDKVFVNDEDEDGGAVLDVQAQDDFYIKNIKKREQYYQDYTLQAFRAAPWCARNYPGQS